MPSAFNGYGQVEEINMLTSYFEGELNSRVKGIEVLEKSLKVRKRFISKAQYIIDVPVPVWGRRRCPEVETSSSNLLRKTSASRESRGKPMGIRKFLGMT